MLLYLIYKYNKSFSVEAQNYITTIKWYKIQSMKKLLEIEHTLYKFVQN